MEKPKLNIQLDEYWNKCSDGCCDYYGTITTINGVELECHNQDAYTMIKQILEHLGYDGKITISASTSKRSTGISGTLYTGGRHNVAQVLDLLQADTALRRLERKYNVTYNSKHNYIVHTCLVCGDEFNVTKYRHEKEPTHGKFCTSCWKTRNVYPTCICNLTCKFIHRNTFIPCNVRKSSCV